MIACDSAQKSNMLRYGNTFDEKIALIKLDGAIADDMADRMVESLRKIRADSKVKAVILRVNSRGGSSLASERILQACKNLPQVRVLA